MTAILATVSGGLATWKGTDYFLNYRELPVEQWVYLWLLTGVALFCLSVYIVGWLFQQLSSRRSEVEPSLLVVGAIGGLLLSSIPVVLPLPISLPPWLGSWLPGWLISVWLLPALLGLVGIRLACQFELPKANANSMALIGRLLVPVLLVGILIWVQNSGFPGVAAPAEVRQEWAAKEFQGYDSVVATIKHCQSIIQRVGRVRWVAPTQGQNYVISDPGSSGHQGEMTLEVIGTNGIGTSRSSFRHATLVDQTQFTHQGRTEKLVCR